MYGFDIYSLFLYPIIYIFPAYVANGSPVIFGGGVPLDLGKRFRGKAIFGRHKTLRGLIFELASGFAIAYAESIFIPYMLAAGIILAIGTHVGDLFGSFAKRRIGKKEGEAVLILDQYLFLVFALLLAIPAGHTPSPYGIVFIFILTGTMHKLTNILAHKAKIKNVPW